jgi:hypothetical protein
MVVASLPPVCAPRLGRPDLHRLPDFEWCGCVGRKPSDGLGVGHHELRVLDRYRPRRNADSPRSCS